MIPIPPLEIQREIVRILDDYTKNVTELQRQLAAETTARKTQYTYYRDELLTNNYNSKIKRLEECCDSIADGDHQAPPKRIVVFRSLRYQILMNDMKLTLM